MFSAPFESAFITVPHPRQTYNPRSTRLASRFCSQHEHVFEVSRSLTTITVIPLAFVLYVSKFVKRSNAHPCKPLLPRSPQFRGLPVSPSSRMPSRLPTAIVPTPRSTHSDTGCWVSEYQADVNAALNITDRYLSGESHSREYTSGDDSAEEGGRLTVPQDSQAVDESHSDSFAHQKSTISGDDADTQQETLGTNAS